MFNGVSFRKLATKEETQKKSVTKIGQGAGLPQVLRSGSGKLSVLRNEHNMCYHICNVLCVGNESSAP